MKKVFHIEKKRLIDYVEVYADRDDIVAYTDNLLENGVLVRSTQGIALKETVEAVEKEKLIDNSISNKYELLLFHKKAFRELVRTTLNGQINELPLIEDAYNFILKNGKITEESDYEVVQYGGRGMNRSKSISNEFIPQAIHFDYMYSNGGFDNERYDLEEMFDVLKDRKDIIWLNGEDELKKGEVLPPMISKIPYYNVTEEAYRQLDFLWAPSDEDFVKANINERELKQTFIMKEIFGYESEDI